MTNNNDDQSASGPQPGAENMDTSDTTPPTAPTAPSPTESDEQAHPHTPVPPRWQPVPSTPLTAEPKPSRSGTWLIVAIIAAVAVAGISLTTVLVLNHRADVAAQERRDKADRKAAAEKATEEKAAEEAEEKAEEKAAAELAAARAAYNGCTQQLKPLLRALQNVDARLDVGLSQAAMSGLVGKVSIAYNRMDIEKLGVGTCLRVAVQLEKAFNGYKGTVQQWNNCIFDYYCDTDAITPGMQGKWLKASMAIERAETLLDSLDPDSSNYDATTSADDA